MADDFPKPHDFDSIQPAAFPAESADRDDRRQGPGRPGEHNGKEGTGCCLACGGCFLLVVVVLIIGLVSVYYTLMRSRPLDVSPETTVLTEPLKEDGKSVDYFSAVKKVRPPVPNEENGFVLLCETFGRSLLDNKVARHAPAPPWMWEAICKEYGLDPNAESKPAFPSFDKLLETLIDQGVGKVDIETEEEIAEEETLSDEEAENDETKDGVVAAAIKTAAKERLHFRVTNASWDEELVRAAEPWIRENEPAFQVIREALSKPKFEFPLLRENESTPFLLSVARLQAFRIDICMGLNSRIRYHLAKKEHAAVWEDLRVLIGNEERFKNRGSVQLHGHGNENRLLFDLLRAEGLPKELLQKMLADLEPEKTVPLLPPINTERAEHLRLIQYQVLDGMAAASRDMQTFIQAVFPELPDEGAHRVRDGFASILSFVGVDWNVATRKFNEEMKPFFEAANELDPAKRLVLDRELLRKYAAYRNPFEQQGKQPNILLLKDRSEIVGSLVFEMIRQTMNTGIMSEYNVREELILFRTAVALELFKAEQGKYPETLDALVPGLLPVPPAGVVDPATPLKYEPVKGTEYKLTGKNIMSVHDGMNGRLKRVESLDRTIDMPKEKPSRETDDETGAEIKTETKSETEKDEEK